MIGLALILNMKLLADLEVSPKALSFGLVWEWKKGHICRLTAASL